MSIRIRKSKASDYSLLIEYDEFIGDRRIDIERGELLVADIADNMCVGFAKLTSNEFLNKPFISIVSTHPTYRRKGVARNLLKAAIDLATWHQIYSTTEEENVQMQSVFTAVGFEKVGAIEGYNHSGTTELIYRHTSSR